MVDEKKDLFRENSTNPSKKLRLTLPLPPSVNRLYNDTKFGGKSLTITALRYIPRAKALINLAIDEQRWVKQSKQTWYYVDLVFYFPDRIRRDSHNMLKLLMDVMQDTAYGNDYYALPRINSVEYDKANPRVEILITPQTTSGRRKALALIGL